MTWMDVYMHRCIGTLMGGHVKFENFRKRNSTASWTTIIQDIYWKLDALQGFIHDLHWPSEEFAKYLQSRMKSLASDMISKCANCTYQCFDNYMQKAKKSTDYVLPSEVCVMINVIFSSKGRAVKLAMDAGEYKYQSKLDETMDTMLSDMEACTRDKLLSILEYTLSRLARYDEGNPIGAILSMAPKGPNAIFSKVKNLVGDTPPPHPQQAKQTAGTAQHNQQQMNVANQAHLGQAYVNFMRGSSEMLQQVVIDEVWVNRLFEHWYEGQVLLINEWLIERLQQSLSPYQLTCLTAIMKKLYSDFELHGIDEEKLNNKMYQSIMRRLQLEENCAAANGGHGHHNLGNNVSYLGSSASQAVSNMGSMVEGAGAKVFALFNK